MAEQPSPAHEHETRNHARHARLTPDRQALAAQHVGLVMVHLRTRLRLRRRTRAGRRDFDELFQTGCLALVQAAARYDPGRDGPFPSYVLPRIRRAVHAAVLAGRSLMRVPYGMACRGRQAGLRGGAPGRRFWPAKDPTGSGPDRGRAGASTCRDRPAGADNETIRHALRRCFERAARQAGDDLARRARRGGNIADIFTRITAERVLVSNPDERTPIRRLAGELGLSSGQVTEYEQRILEATRDRLRDDAPVRVLVHLASLDPDGFDGPVNAGRRRRVLHAQVRQFERAFAAAAPAERARILYSLVERSAAGVEVVARNLFLLTLPNP